MKNKEYQKMLVMALTVSLTIGSMGVSDPGPGRGKSMSDLADDSGGC